MNADLQHRIDRRLPSWARRVILSGLCGSHVHGTYITPEEAHGTDDEDVFQLIAHPRDHYLGLSYYRHQWDGYQTHGESLDIVVHEVAKFIYLCAQGNPNVNTYLWLEPIEYASTTTAGEILLASRDVFISQKMFPAFGGYAYAQLKKMAQGAPLGYMGAKRKALMEQHGYDIKNAAHCLRLFYTGIRLATTGQLLVKLTGHELDDVLAVKQGRWSASQVERCAMALDQEFRMVCRQNQVLPVAPDPVAVDRVLRTTLEAHWDTLH